MITKTDRANNWYTERFDYLQLRDKYFPELKHTSLDDYRGLTDEEIIYIWKTETNEEGNLYTEKEILNMLSSISYEIHANGYGPYSTAHSFASNFFKEIKNE